MLLELSLDQTHIATAVTLANIRHFFLITICFFARGLCREDAVASPGFIARRGKDGNYVMGTHGGLQGRVLQLLDD